MSEAATKTRSFNIQRFCGVGDPREWLLAPWRDRGHIYATNGHWLAEIVDDGREVVERDKHPDVVAMFTKNERTTDWRDIPVLPPKVNCDLCKGKGGYRLIACLDCDGDGHFEHGNHDYTCKECEGTGNIGDEDKDTICTWCDGIGESCSRVARVDFAINGYDARYLRWLRKLPGIRVAESTLNGPLLFEFEGGRGLLMPMRKD